MSTICGKFIAIVAALLLTAACGPAHASVITDPGGLLYYLDAAQGVSLSGSLVTGWADLGTAGNNFVASVGKEPTWIASSINGLPAVQFGGAQELLLNTATQPKTVIAVTRVNAGGGLRGIWGSEGADKGIRLLDTSNYANNTTGDANDLTKGDFNGVRVNGLVTSRYTVGQPHVLAEFRGPNHNATTYNVTSIGEYFAGRGYIGDVAELVAYDHVLTNSQIVAIENYFGSKYGVTTFSAAPRPGTPIAGLIGGDLTDPENDATPAGANLNGTVTASVKPGFGGENFGNVFTNSAAKYCCNGPTQSVTFQFNEGRRATLSHYTLTSSNDSPQRDPLDWTISGSNDGVNFAPIHQVVGSNGPGIGDDTIWDGRNQTIRFNAGTDFAAPAERYNYLRFQFTRTDQDGALNEIEYFGTLSGPILSPGGDGAIGKYVKGGQGGRYIEISKQQGVSTDILHVGEVEAFLVGATINPSATDPADLALASKGAAAVTVAGGFFHGADGALINGVVDGGADTWTRSVVAGTGARARIDLGQDFDLGAIRVWQRGDGCCPERLADFTVELYAQDGEGIGPLVYSQFFSGQVPAAAAALFNLPAMPLRIVDFALPADGELLMDVDAASGQADLLTVTGQLTAAGLLDVSNIGGTFQVGQTFNLLDFGSITGTFGQINLPAVQGGGWDLSRLYLEGTITFVPEPSTFALGALALAGLALCAWRRRLAG